MSFHRPRENRDALKVLTNDTEDKLVTYNELTRKTLSESTLVRVKTSIFGQCPKKAISTKTHLFICDIGNLHKLKSSKINTIIFHMPITKQTRHTDYYLYKS